MDELNAGSINQIVKNLIMNFNTLLDCPARFSGEFNEQKIHCFVEYIDYYKRIKCISDEQALHELQYLLVDHAYNWWMRRKRGIETWSEALTILENQYSKKRPPNKVYEEILRHPYKDYQSKYDFIDDKMELFTELPPPELTEKNKLDIIYALLPNEVQNEIKLQDITSVKDLEKHLKLVESVIIDGSSNQVSAVLNCERTPGCSTILAENGNVVQPNKESSSQGISKQILPENNNIEDCRDRVIKVRRTEDLMPTDVKEEDKNQDNIIPNETKSSDVNNMLHSSQESFEIDSDIMNQINNIIDETEMCIEAIGGNENSSSTLLQTSSSVLSLELLGFQIESANQKESANREGKSFLNSTKKTKKRCRYCRSLNHTVQTCLKKAKHIKLFPERFPQTKLCENNNSKTNNERPSEILPSNTPNNNLSCSNTKMTEVSETFNSVLTTKLIPAINGKAPNKILAAKLRNINTPSPKCHQCGTLGFYKSICPNCSPIYNNSHK